MDKNVLIILCVYLTQADHSLGAFCFIKKGKYKMKWKVINNIAMNIINLIIICISIYLCINYSMWWILLLLLL
jgi:hypothetical protein